MWCPRTRADYSVQITNSGGSLTSSNALLTVLVPRPNSMPAALVADQPAGYWRLDETNANPVAADYFGGNNGAYLGDGSLATGPDRRPVWRP